MTERCAQIIAFPFQQCNAEACDSYQDGVFQLKLEAAQMLNEVAAGIYRMSPRNVRAVQRVNEMCRQVGLIPLDHDPTI